MADGVDYAWLAAVERAKLEFNASSTISIKLYLNKVRGGSSAHALALAGQFSTIPRTLRATALDSLCSCLTKDHPCQRRSNADSELRIVACSVLEIIGDFEDSSYRITSNLKLLAVLLQYGDDVVRWSHRCYDEFAFLARSTVARAEVSESDHRDHVKLVEGVFTNVANVVALYASLDPTRKFIRDISVAPLVVRLWLADDSWLVNESGSMIRVGELLYSCCQAHSPPSQTFEKIVLTELEQVEATDKLDSNHLSNLAISRIQSALQADDMDAIQAYTRAMHAIIVGAPPSPRIRECAMLLTVGTNRLVSKPDVNDRHLSALRDYVTNGLIDDLFEAPNGVVLFVQSLQAGLLSIIFHCHAQLRKLEESQLIKIRKLFADTIPHFLIIHTVWKEVIHALGLISPQLIARFDTSLRGPTWKQFSRHLLEMSVFYNEIDRYIESYGRCLYCDACFNMYPRTDLKSCTQCRTEMYCSRECQVIGWREMGHRKRCANLAKFRTLRPSLRTLDRFYLAQLALYDYRRHDGFLNHLVGRNDMSNLPHIRDAFPKIDYSTNPAMISLRNWDPNSAQNLEHQVIRAIFSRDSSTDQAMHEYLLIPRKFADDQYGSRHLRPPKANPLKKARDFVSQVRPRGSAEVVNASRSPAVDEVDVLVYSIVQEHARKPDRSKHIWQRIEELTVEVRKPENWPFVDYGPFAPSSSSRLATSKDDDLPRSESE